MSLRAKLRRWLADNGIERLPALSPAREEQLRALAGDEPFDPPVTLAAPMPTEIPLPVRLAADLGWTIVPVVGWLKVLQGRVLQFHQRQPRDPC